MKKQIISDLFAVIGRPLAQSYSATYWNEKFKQKRLSGHLFEALELKKVTLIKDFMKSHPNLRGFCVTIPYKESIIPLLDEIDPVAKEIGAVNCVRVVNGGDGAKLIGYNTDCVGFAESVKPLLTPKHKRALILGTGGASKAVKYALNSLGVECTFVSRSKDGCLKYSELTEQVMRENTIIVNTTPVGSFPNSKECPDIPYEYITPDHLVLDIIYNPIRTLFLQQAELKGATIKNGWDMFTNQAEQAWRIFEVD